MKRSKKNKFFNSLNFNTWLYFMLFTLSILLLLQIFQIILLEPFYKSTYKKEIIDFNENVYNTAFSELDSSVKNDALYNLTSSNHACVLIYNTDTTTATAFDSIGENGCAIYSNGNVNSQIIEAMDNSEEDTYYLEGNLVEVNNQDVMIYGEKKQIDETEYYIISNFAMEDIDAMIRITQKQFIYIALIILGLSTIISFIFSRIISKPIEDIKNEALKLTQGNYDVNFDSADVNEFDDLSETLNLAATELEGIEQTRKELMSNVSHDLKTPLTMIKAYAEMIKDISGDDKEKRNEHLDIIIDETDNLNKLVSDMLDLSKLQDGVYSVEIEPFDLSTNILQTIEKFDTFMAQENVTIEAHVEPELIAYGDADRLDEVLNNFITNAFKHYGEDRKVIVNAYLVNRDTIRVEVVDHGSGIEEDVLPYIWDRYFKSDKKYARSKSGSGLGLAINKAILEAHHAEYGVITKVNEGSTFYFELKAVPAE